MISETLESINKQDYGNLEIIVVDDGSSDPQWNTLKELASDRVRILERTDGTKGPSRCRNLGAAESAGDYILFVDSDDVLAPWCLAQRMNEIAEWPGADFWVFPVMLFRQQPGDLAVCWNRLEGDDDVERFLRSDPPWHTSSPVWRRETFMTTGGFNENVMYGDDAELHARALLKGFAYRKFPKCLPDVFVRRGEEQRITNAQLPSLLASRQARLIEGTLMLRTSDADQHLVDIWEGQYFVEGEELLFNLSNSDQHIAKVIDAWAEQYTPSICYRWLVRSYFRLGTVFRDQAYWALRVARRLAMVALPGDYFPKGGGFHSQVLSAGEAARLNEALQGKNEK